MVEEAAPVEVPRVPVFDDDVWEGVGPATPDIAREYEYDGNGKECPAAAVPADGYIVDIGAGSTDAIVERVASSAVGTVLVYGPMGVVETPDCQNGTREVLDAVAAATKSRAATSIVVGGSLAVWAASFGHADTVTLVSRGGPGVARLLSGRHAPGLAALATTSSR